jgi:glycosyltransferase involved in cell wall biosynthesis
MCWGTPLQAPAGIARDIKLRRLTWIVNRASCVLVNDLETREELRALSGRQTTVVPYVVDSDFYTYSGTKGRESFILVPGDKDRDEALVSALAAKGVNVVRVSRNLEVRTHYGRSGARGVVDVRLAVSYEELRNLYHKARAVVLPLARADHAVGQTAALEAIACGAPVVLSAGRTADMFRGIGTVLVCRSSNVDEWEGQLTVLATASSPQWDARAREASSQLSRIHHPTIVAMALKELIASIDQ